MRKNMIPSRELELVATLYKRPQAEAWIKGNDKYPDIEGVVRFYQTTYGVLVEAEISGLPHNNEKCGGNIFAFHIHEGVSCKQGREYDFPETGGHYNPWECNHPHHAGDMLSLFGNAGYTFMIFLTNRFSVKEIVGRTVIIHSKVDDFISQPSGNAGEKIACAEIKGYMKK